MRKKLLLITLIILILIALLLVINSRQHHDDEAITLFGNVDVRQVDLGFKVSGKVISMPFQEGDLVEEGTLMAELDKQPFADQVAQADASLQSTKVNLDYAEKVLKRRQALLNLNDGSISQEDYENALNTRDALLASQKQAEATLGVAKTNLADTSIYAPSTGVILTRIREPGTVVRVSDPVYTLSLTSPIWVRAFVTEPDLGLVYPGMPAEIYTDSSDKIYHGHIGFISPVAEFTPKTVETTQLRSDLVYRLRIIANNPDRGLRQGMPVTVRLPLQPDSNDDNDE